MRSQLCRTHLNCMDIWAAQGAPGALGEPQLFTPYWCCLLHPVAWWMLWQLAVGKLIGGALFWVTADGVALQEDNRGACEAC